MAFDWRDYLGLAMELSDDADTAFPEAASRSAVSRAYFSSYNVALTYAQRRWGWRPPVRGADKHQAVARKFRDEGQDEIADRLDTMRHSRNAADYDDAAPALDVQLQFALSYAEEVSNALG